jgi:hypothetical protein
MDDKNIKIRGLKDKLVLDSESYETLLNMFSGDDEDKILALECINNIDQKKSLIYTLFLRRNADVLYSLWKANSPKVLKYHSSLGFKPSNNMIKYGDILEIIKTQDNKEENLNFFLADFSRFLKDTLINSFDFMSELEIVTKFKDNEKQK